MREITIFQDDDYTVTATEKRPGYFYIKVGWREDGVRMGNQGYLIVGMRDKWSLMLGKLPKHVMLAILTWYVENL